MPVNNMHSCSWPVGAVKSPGFFRKRFSHQVISLDDPNTGIHFGFDDEVSMGKITVSMENK